jgi:hypothetical protein
LNGLSAGLALWTSKWVSGIWGYRPERFRGYCRRIYPLFGAMQRNAMCFRETANFIKYLILQ